MRGRSYSDRDGQPRYSLEINANEVQFLGGRGEGEVGGGYGDREGFGGGRDVANGGGDPPPYDETDDLPF